MAELLHNLALDPGTVPVGYHKRLKLGENYPIQGLLRSSFFATWYRVHAAIQVKYTEALKLWQERAQGFQQSGTPMSPRLVKVFDWPAVKATGSAPKERVCRERRVICNI